MNRQSACASMVCCLLGLGACRTTLDSSPAGDDPVSTTHVTSAEVEAPEDLKAAEDRFDDERGQYLAEASTELAELDRKITILAAKAKVATGQKKIERSERLSDIRKAREAFMDEFDALEASSAVTWDEAKIKVDEAWTKLTTLVDAA